MKGQLNYLVIGRYLIKMAILIKGVKIPNTCIECPCLHKTISTKCFCSITQTPIDKTRLSQNKRNEDCPIQDVYESSSAPQLPFKYAVSDYVLRKGDSDGFID